MLVFYYNTRASYSYFCLYGNSFVLCLDVASANIWKGNRDLVNDYCSLAFARKQYLRLNLFTQDIFCVLIAAIDVIHSNYTCCYYGSITVPVGRSFCDRLANMLAVGRIWFGAF